ncbi:MAG: hypothetical protein FVQ77_01630 [Cytophagales bacterium]|nr:hypothetical protein [Cytophagales bacterium]
MDIGSSMYSSRLGEVLQITDKVDKYLPASLNRGDIEGEIIDKFIETQPTIPIQGIENLPRQRRDQEPKIKNKKDLSTSSAKEDKKLATENLANILATYGNIKKAIDIYKKLILKYPGKKAYFAARIKKLQKKLL